MAELERIAALELDMISVKSTQINQEQRLVSLETRPVPTPAPSYQWAAKLKGPAAVIIGWIWKATKSIVPTVACILVALALAGHFKGCDWHHPIDPNPPGPTPTPAPIPVAGFRVLIVYESSQALPSKQQAILTSATVIDYLDKKCVPTPDGNKRGWYIVDKDTSFKNESKTWQDAMARPRRSIPWILISDGKTGTEEPLPATVEDTISLLKKYGG